MLDISLNTYRAMQYVEYGANPYEYNAQVWHTIQPGPNVEINGDAVTMFGVPYYYGYPYFPAMFISYFPFYKMFEGLNAIRFFNITIFICNLIGVLWLIQRLSPRRIEPQYYLLTLIAYLGLYVYPNEIFVFCIVDVILSCFLLFAFISLSLNK